MTFHAQMVCEVERTIYTLEDMLRAFVINFKGSWNDYLPFIEFTYNNSFYFGIQIALYKAVYGCRCRSLGCWFELCETVMIRPEFVYEAIEKV